MNAVDSNKPLPPGRSQRLISRTQRKKLTDNELRLKIKEKFEELPPVKVHTKSPSKRKGDKHQGGLDHMNSHRERKAEKSLGGDC